MSDVARALGELHAWIEALPNVVPGTPEHTYAVTFTREFVERALAINGFDPENLDPLREAARRRIPEITLDTSHPLHSAKLVKAVERDPIVPLIPQGWLRKYYMYVRGAYAPLQYSIAAGFTILGAWMGRRVWHTRHGRFTIYPPASTILISTIPGLGKGTALEAARTILRSLDYPWIAPNRITCSKLITTLSKQSRRDAYNPSEALVLADEMVGFFLESGSNSKNTANRMILDLTELYDMKADFSSATQVRDTERIFRPTVSTIFCVTLHDAADFLPRNAFGGGFIPRQTICLQTSEDLPAIPSDLSPPPGSLADAVEGLRVLRQLQGPAELDRAANRRVEALIGRIEHKIRHETDDRIVAYLKRIPTNAIRMAMSIAVSQGRLQIIEDDYDRALRIMRVFERSYGYLFERVGTSPYGYLRQSIYHVIRRATILSGGITQKNLSLSVQHHGIRHREFQDICADLTESGLVTYGPIKGGSAKVDRIGWSAKKPRGKKATLPIRERATAEGPITQIDVDQLIGDIRSSGEGEDEGYLGSGVNLETMDEEWEEPVGPTG